jgi:hypothetical protein
MSPSPRNGSDTRRKGEWTRPAASGRDPPRRPAPLRCERHTSAGRGDPVAGRWWTMEWIWLGCIAAIALAVLVLGAEEFE